MSNLFDRASLSTELVPLTQEEDNKSTYGTCELSKTQRLIAGVVCFLIGVFSIILALISIFLVRVRKFSLLFSISNLMFFVSIGFIVGFKTQFSSIKEKNRYIAFSVLIISMLLTFVFGIAKRNFFGILICIIIEIISFLYYSLSYVPWLGTKILSHLFF